MLCLSCEPNNTPKTYTITYELGGGKLKDGETNPTVYTSETETFTLKNPIHESWEFLGWKSKGSDDSTAKSNVTIEKGSSGNLSFVAVWKALETFSYVYYEDENYYAVKCVDKTITSCVISSEYEGLPVKRIEGWGFKNCTQLSSITIPGTIKYISRSAFQDCSSLTSIILQKGVFLISDFAFQGCSALESIYLPKSLNYIANNLFLGCQNLKDIHYEGTLEEWEKTSKGPDWDTTIKDKYTIHYNGTKK